MSNLTIGANAIKEIQLRDNLGNNLVLADLEDVTVKIVQYNRTLETLVYGTDDELQDGSTSSKLKIEIKKALSQTFREGNVYARVIEDNTDAAFEVDSEARYLPDYLLFYAVLVDTENQSVTSDSVGSYWRGDWNPTGNILPNTGGNGLLGVPAAGDEWRLIDTLVIGGNVYGAGTVVKAAISTPGQTVGNWIFIATQL